LGYTANNITGIIAAQYLGNVKLGMYVLAGMGMVLGILHVLLTNEKSNVNEPREPFNWKTIWEHFAFPTAGSHDYWFAVAGKFCSNMGGMLIGTYLLYILTDYIKMNQGQAGKMMAMYSTITLIGGLIFNAISGPIADKMGRLKLPVAVSVAIMGIAQLFPFFDAAPWTIYVFAIVSSIASGIYGAVDGALNLAVLPNKETAGKDMGFLNLSNTLSQIAAAWVASGVVLTFGYKAIFPAAFLLSLAGAILTWRIKAVK
jgi:MFS family permease